MHRQPIRAPISAAQFSIQNKNGKLSIEELFYLCILTIVKTDHLSMCCFKNEFLLNRYCYCFFSIIAFISLFIFGHSAYGQSVKNAAYYQAKGYQVFPEYGFAIKAPVTLEDVSSLSDGDFALNYAGVQDTNAPSSCFYQIMISKLPAGYKNYSEKEITGKVKEMLKEQMSRFKAVQPIFFSENSYVGYVGETTFNGKKQKGVMFYRDGCIYALTVISNSMLESRFNTFTNAIKFFPKEVSSFTSSSSGRRQYIKEAGVYVSAPCILEKSSEANYDYVYIGASNPENKSIAEVYRVSINLLPLKLSQMISSDREQIKNNIKEYARSKGAYTIESINIPSVLCYSIASQDQGFNVKECVVLTDSAVLEFIVFSKKSINPIYRRFIESISTK